MRDELLKDFGQAGAPPSDEPSMNAPKGARVSEENVNGKTWPFAGPVAEYQPRATTLPEQVSAAEVARRSLERTYNMGEGNRSALAGTVLPEGDNENG
jgi:hypothetical protein